MVIVFMGFRKSNITAQHCLAHAFACVNPIFHCKAVGLMRSMSSLVPP